MDSPLSLRAYLFPALAILAGLLFWRLGDDDTSLQETARPSLGLFTSLPLYWGDAADIAEFLGGEAEAHWARAEIERGHVLQPLDVLSDESLAPFDRLLTAQPRALSPQENVALDGWVRAGGRLLLFADPALTAESRFAPGDPRRPSDVALLSPILAHWGLELTFDPAQPAGERVVDLSGIAVPVEMAGGFSAIGSGSDAGCEILDGGLAAICSPGSGRALIVADAALFDGGAVAPASRRQALSGLLERAFAE